MKLWLDTSKAYAIALEGGGAKGAYEVGVWKALDEAGVRFDAVAGTSVGALNGAMMVMGELEQALRLWENIRFSQVFDADDEQLKKLYDHKLSEVDFRTLFKDAIEAIHEGGLDIEPLRRLIAEWVDEEKIRASEKKLFLVTYSLTDKRELDMDADELEGFLRAMPGVRHVTAALELDADGSFLRRALSCGATVGLGHSMATYEQAMRAFADGTTAVTHLYNALPPLHHRAGGAVCAALLSPDISCELICDGFHIAPEMVRLAATLKRERLVLITDSMEATGCPDGEYRIAGMPVTVKDGKARTHDGAIAGSTLSLLDGVRNYAAFAGVSFGTAVYAATMAPAIEVGLEHEIGSLEPGKRADLLILNADGTPAQVMCGGVFCGSANRGAV